MKLSQKQRRLIMIINNYDYKLKIEQKNFLETQLKILQMVLMINVPDILMKNNPY